MDIKYYKDGQEIGEVTTGTQSPTLNEILVCFNG